MICWKLHILMDWCRTAVGLRRVTLLHVRKCPACNPRLKGVIYECGSIF